MTVMAILEAATYILEESGPGGFTANKVAERAGVNIASFYQYFPNKEALLFRLAQITWDRQLARLRPILTNGRGTHAERLKAFVSEFFEIEAAEADLRQALRIATVDLRETREFLELTGEGAKLTRNFLVEALGLEAGPELDFHADFIVLIVTSFVERSTDAHPSRRDRQRQAELLAGMLITQFGIR